jgi:hypothetical protein
VDIGLAIRSFVLDSLEIRDLNNDASSTGLMLLPTLLHKSIVSVERLFQPVN